MAGEFVIDRAAAHRDRRLVAAIDVGSSSVRAGLFTLDGRMLARSTVPIAIHRPLPDHAEQSTAEIWAAACTCVRDAVRAAGCDADAVAALAFDATSSLALGQPGGEAASVSVTGDDHWDVVMWCDHRAVAEAAAIDRTGHRALAFVGGHMSPEMVLPKLCWLKRHLPHAWSRYGLALDLTDWLSWRATGRRTASHSALTCKWGYLAHDGSGWPQDLLASIGIEELTTSMTLPPRGLPTASAIGPLSPAAAAELGLSAACIVAVGVIDAQAGCLGPLASLPDSRIENELAVIGGTSTCHMAISPTPHHVPGVWGPYPATLLPGRWLNEGGQAATGASLEHIVAGHVAAAALGDDPHAQLWQMIEARDAATSGGWLPHMVVVPDFNGNRSPLSDPGARGLIWGLTLDASIGSLVELYAATAIGAVLGTRHVIDVMNAHGYAIERLHLIGGHARSRGFAP